MDFETGGNLTMGEAFLNLQFRKSYPEFTLELDVSFSTGITAIFGPSGSGKSTTLNCISGIAKPDSGYVELWNRPLFMSGSRFRRINRPPEKRRIGYVFQEGLLFPHLRVRENILYGYNQTPKNRRHLRPNHLVEILELEPLLHRMPSTLSGGERQRVALARAMAASPEVLLLDEPLASLDMQFKGRILRHLKSIHHDTGIPMVYVSHTVSEVIVLADQALVLANGQQVALGTPKEVLLKTPVLPLVDPTHLETLLEGRVVAQHPKSGTTEAEFGGFTLWLPVIDRDKGEPITVSVEASDVMVAAEAPPGLSARNVLKARVSALNRVGDIVIVTADAGKPVLANITPEATTSLGLQPGSEVYLVLKASSIVLLG
ncbi:MAG: molybdenum ABC transporter ATP-binding protein [Chloroflexota bacterium]|nr:molybdenum ABC transporter ATP-binding protein [Chloroflexota bacterium]